MRQIALPGVRVRSELSRSRRRNIKILLRNLLAHYKTSKSNGADREQLLVQARLFVRFWLAFERA